MTRKKLGITVPLPQTTPNRTLHVARDMLRKKLERGESCKCQLCGAPAKVYSRAFRRPYVRALQALAENVYLSAKEMSEITGGRDYPHIAEWGLALRHNGFWRITDKGRAFLAGEIEIPERSIVYTGKHLGFDRRKTINVNDPKMQSQFNIGDLLNEDHVKDAVLQ